MIDNVSVPVGIVFEMYRKGYFLLSLVRFSKSEQAGSYMTFGLCYLSSYIFNLIPHAV